VLSAAELALHAGQVEHIFADDEDGLVNATARTVSVTVSDEDGGSSTTTKTVTVNNVAPLIDLAGASNVVEDSAYTLTLGGVTDPGQDHVTGYIVHWGDGREDSYSAAGDVVHVYADAGSYDIVVDLVDEDGTHLLAGSRGVSVTMAPKHNSDPLAVDDSYIVQAGHVLTIAAPGLLANDSDPDSDPLTVASFIQPLHGTVSLGQDGSFTYTPFAGFYGIDSWDYTISDGLSSDRATVTIEVQPATETIRIGDAPTRITSNLQLVNAWSHPRVIAIEHTANASLAVPVWSSVLLGTLNGGTLAGGDIFNGDLGVSGQSAATSAVKQEIDGSEALRFSLLGEATRASIDISRLYLNDDGSSFRESGRVRLLDHDGAVVAESTFLGDSAAGDKTVVIESARPFVRLELSAGSYDGASFVYGGYSKPDGSFGSGVYSTPDGKQHGSEFLVDSIDFDVVVDLVGVPLQS